MNENEFQFRTSAFGGFQKQDVMNYLERNAREHAEAVAALQKELAEEKVARAEGEEKLSDLEKRLAALEEEKSTLSAQLAEREEELRRVKEEREELQTMAAGLQDQVDKLAPAAAAYEAVKDRTASIELEAHGRAQAIEQEGRQKAKKCQEQVKEWFAKTRQVYARLQTDMQATLGHAVRELERAGQSMSGLHDSLDGQEDALEAIQAQIEALDGPKLPQPLSLEEK